MGFYHHQQHTALQSLRQIPHSQSCYGHVAGKSYVSLQHARCGVCDADRKKKNTGWQTPYVVLSSAKDVMNDQDLLIPYQSFLHYKNHIKSFAHHSKPWAQRIDKAVWWGSSTGGLFTP
jgi:hypothetical protein